MFDPNYIYYLAELSLRLILTTYKQRKVLMVMYRPQINQIHNVWTKYRHTTWNFIRHNMPIDERDPNPDEPKLRTALYNRLVKQMLGFNEAAMREGIEYRFGWARAKWMNTISFDWYTNIRKYLPNTFDKIYWRQQTSLLMWKYGQMYENASNRRRLLIQNRNNLTPKERARAFADLYTQHQRDVEEYEVSVDEIEDIIDELYDYMDKRSW